MSEDGDIDVESAEDVPDIGVEATAHTINSNGDIYDDGSHPDKRAHHNALERRRRDHIKDSFHSLRDCIPSLVGEKVSRAHILNKATEYIRHMQKGGSTREDDICDMARKNEILEEQVRALDEAKLRGGSINAEDVLQSVASRVEARQLQERLQQVAPKNNSKSTKQVNNKPAPKTSSSSSSALNSTSSEKPSQKTVPPPSRTPDIPTSTSAHLSPNFNLLANNIKSTQSLLNVLQKNFSPNNNLPSSIKSLAARVLASPLVRNAQKNSTQKTSQASSVPRGIVTATTVNSTTKGTAQLSPSATPLSKQTSSRVTGINATPPSSQRQLADSAQVIVPMPITAPPRGEASSHQITESLLASCDGIDPAVTLQAISGNASIHQPPPPEGLGANSPSSTFLTSQLLEAHNLLQQQGSSLNSIPSAVGGELGGAVPLAVPPEDTVVDVSDPSSSALNVAAQGLNISPELLAQVTSLFNFPVPATTGGGDGGATTESISGEGAALFVQDITSAHPPSQATPNTNPLKRPVSIESLEPVAKKPHLQQ